MNEGEQKILYCPKCGKEREENGKFCIQCGYEFGNPLIPEKKHTGLSIFQNAAAETKETGLSIFQNTAITKEGENASHRSYQHQSVSSTSEIALPYASFWRRVLAYLIDTLIYFVMLVIQSFLMVEFLYDRFGDILVIIPLLTYFFYKTLMESSKLQATVGKLILKIKVTDLNGDRISFARATGRFFGMYLSSILCIGYILVFFTEKKQTLHDMLANTLVINHEN